MGELQIHVGAAGSGKSTRIADAIAKEVQQRPLGPRIYWIVPSVASYTTEQRLLEQIPGTVRVEVIHLARLAERANQEVHSVSGTPINNTGKRMLLAAVYQEALNELSLLGRVEPSVGILDAILDVFDEMVRFSLSPDAIEAQLESAATQFENLDAALAEVVTGRSLIGKLRDVSLLYVRFQRELAERNLYNPVQLPTLAAANLEQWQELRGATLYVDGFTDLSPQDAYFITRLAKHAKTTLVTLDLAGVRDLPTLRGTTWDADDKIVRDAPSFGPWLSLQRLAAIAELEQIGVKLESSPLLPSQGRYQQAPQLATLEALLRTGFDGGDREHLLIEAEPEPVASKDTTEARRNDTAIQISLAGAQNIRAETDGVAATIRRRLNDCHQDLAKVAVLVPDVAQYAPHLRNSFEAYGVPYTIDEYPLLMQHPLTKFVLASLRVCEESYSLESVCRLLKTEFCGLEQTEADWLESYLSAHEVEGRKAWLTSEPWRFQQTVADEQKVSAAQTADRRAEACRGKVLAWLKPFDETLTEQLTPSELALALWRLFTDTGVKKTVANWMANEAEADERSTDSHPETQSRFNPLEGSLHEQAWLKWIALLNDLSETKVGRALSRDFLFSLIYEECASQSLTTIPAGLRQVRVFAYAHAVAWEAEDVYVLGVADGVLPKRITHKGLLQDEERLQFASLFGQRLGYTTQEQQQFERAQLYSIFTRASRYLHLSVPLSNEDGKALRPSLLFQQLREWFGPHCGWELWARDTTASLEGHAQLRDRPPLRVLEEAIPLLRWQQIPDEWESVLPILLKTYMETETLKSAILSGVRGLAHTTGARRLPHELIEGLYGAHFFTNVYQLETFAACNYRHFLQYGLRLHPEEIPDVTPAERGTLIHDTLQTFVAHQMQDIEQWRQLSDGAVEVAIESAFQRVLASPKAQLWLRRPSRREQADEALAVLQKAGRVLTEHIRHGDFVPAALELSFGDGPKDNLPPLTLSLSEGREVSLRGRIDRVDVTGEGSEKVFRVLDYKSSKLDLDLTKIHHGLRLQLPAYGVAAAVHSPVWSGGRATLAGVFYLPVLSELKVSTTPQTVLEAKSEQVKVMRARGWMVAKESVISAMDKRIVQGESDLFKKVYKADGSFQKSAPVLTEGHWQGFLGHVMSRVKALAEGILDGQVQIRPFRLGAEEACTFCPYQSICQLDKRWDGHLFRKLDSVSQAVLDDWTAEAKVSEELLSGGMES